VEYCTIGLKIVYNSCWLTHLLPRCQIAGNNSFIICYVTGGVSWFLPWSTPSHPLATSESRQILEYWPRRTIHTLSLSFIG